MPGYQVISRKYRPSRFAEVIGQDPVVTTLTNALMKDKIAHAYLFSGIRGTGKTTLARLFAKAINCEKRDPKGEPCNQCSSCKEIAAGSSIDLLEIDGASHRGIEDIRQINESACYLPSHGKYKIYLIDEVHMLTKEAFNALLKTLEEPPEKVKFFFATTEPHKIPATILSRCQRFNLARVSPEKIAQRLAGIGKLLELDVSKEAIHLIAELSEGSLRDAESLFDQAITFAENKTLSLQDLTEILGLVPKHWLFEIDEAGYANDIKKIFEISEKIFASGKNLSYFLEELLYHYRTLLLLSAGDEKGIFFISEEERQAYKKVLPYFGKNQLFKILEILSEAEIGFKAAPSERVYIETVLLKIAYSFKRIPLEEIVERLLLLEKRLTSPLPEEKVSPQAPQENAKPASPPEKNSGEQTQMGRNDTIVRFAAKELEGTVKKL